mgnify:CR=1 FL=1
MDAVGAKAQGRKSRPVSDQALDGLEVGTDGVWHGTAADGDESGLGRFRRFGNVVDEALVVALNGIDFIEAGNIDHALRIVGPRFIVRIVRRVAARRIVHDDEAA